MELREIRFKSQTHPDTRGYIVVRDKWDARNDGFYREPGYYLDAGIFQFDTYGDGLTQHSHPFMVPASEAKDFLVSLSFYLMELGEADRAEAVAVVAVDWPEEYRGEAFGARVRFLQSLKYSETKRTFFNLGEQKKSTSEKLQYDKRWEELKSSWEPTLPNIYGALFQSFRGVLHRWALWEAIREAMDYPWVDEETILGILGLKRDDLCGRQGFDFVSQLVKAHRIKNGALSTWSCLQSNWENEKPVKEEEEIKEAA